jgi:ABC-2 type transport system permease protein
MRSFAALVGKNLRDARWPLALSTLAVFGWSWLMVYSTSMFEARLRRMDATGDALRGRRMLQSFGGQAMDFSSTALEMVGWNHPILILTLGLWAIGRGSAAISGELERGTLDLTLSRPISRAAYFLSHVAVALFGLLVLGAAMVAGNQIGGHYNTVEEPPRWIAVARAALNLAMLGFAIFSAALLLSALDVVRWRPSLIAAGITIAMYIARIVASLPGLEQYEWLARYSIFRAYDPVEAALRGEHLAFNAVLLGAIGTVAAVVGLVIFSERDLPAGGG